jgi:hypothetical protein
MFRRSISWLVIAGFVASQMAAIPHAHGGMSPAEQLRHNATPHFHCHSHCHGDHDHSHGEQVHKHSVQRQAARVAFDGELLLKGPSDAEHHDAFAVFMPLQTGVVSAPGQNLAHASQLTTIFSPAESLHESYSSRNGTLRWHPPDKVEDASGTYLTLRNLRI